MGCLFFGQSDTTKQEQKRHTESPQMDRIIKYGINARIKEHLAEKPNHRGSNKHAIRQNAKIDFITLYRPDWKKQSSTSSR